MVKPQLVLITALLLLTSGVAAQEQAPNQSEDSVLGEDVIASNFVMRGLPGSSQEEVEADRSFEREADSDESYNLSEDEALEVARDELGSSEWNLEDSERSEGLYEFSFVRGESEAEVSVDGSSGRIVEFEAEIEWEPENEEPSAVLSGFIQFSREGYEVDTDIDVDEENNEALFEVEIEQDDEVGAEVITREEIREFEDAAPGNYTGRLEVVRDDEVVHTEEQEFRVPGPVENESEDEESEDDESEDESEESLEDMSREDLIEEVRSLREQVQSLQNRNDSDNSEAPGNRPDGIETPEDSDEESEDDSEDSENETEETESENESEDSESSGPPTEAPGNSDQRPGFVNRMLSGIFG
ncbi:MAG: hypothetical protein R6V35_02400 [Candidatus Nanohaloarchaea archaeon]